MSLRSAIASIMRSVAAALARAEADAERERATSQIADATRHDAYRALKLHGLGEAPEIIAVFCDAATSAGAGLGVLPRFIGDADDSLCRVLPERTIRRSFWLVTHQDMREAKKVRTFRDWLTALVATHRGRFV